MTVTSNLAGVMDRMRRLPRAVPVALARTLEPASWLVEARAAAERALKAEAKPAEEIYIGRFVAAVISDVLAPGPGFSLALRAPPSKTPMTLADLQTARSLMRPGFQDLFRQQVQEFEDLLEQWVANEKRKDRRDAGQSDRDIAEFISYALLSPDGDTLKVKSGKNKDMLVGDVFAPHIAKYLAAQSVTGQLPPTVVTRWLRAVLTAWKEMVRVVAPRKFHKELKLARKAA